MSLETSLYEQYSQTKESGESWLGKIPSHWNLVRFKSIFRIRKKIAGELGHDVLSITQRGIKLKDTTSGDGQLSMDYSKYQLVSPGDFAMNHMDLLTGYVDISKFDGVTSPDYRVFRLVHRESASRYWLYVLQLCYISKIFFPLGQGAAHIGRWRLPTDGFYEFVGAAPELTEQQNIANFLDHETAKIDALIEKQQQLIKLLKEKRQAVISHAVTKGLNPDVPMKDSGVEWLGDVPAGWDLSKFHYEIYFLEGPGIMAVDFHESGVPLMRINNVKGRFVNSDFSTYLSPELVSSKWSHFQVGEGDLIISASASTGLVSEVDLQTAGAVPYTGLIILRPRSERIIPDYIRFFVQSETFEKQIANLQTGATIQHFGPIHLKQLWLTLPTVEQQKQICVHIEEQIKYIDTVIVKAESANNLSLERRTALISAAVTGKIDVRNWQAPESTSTPSMDRKPL